MGQRQDQRQRYLVFTPVPQSALFIIADCVMICEVYFLYFYFFLHMRIVYSIVKNTFF